jgi:hypothetical protein
VESQENKVLFKTSESESRSFIGGNLSTVGTKIQMYGYHDDSFLAANKEGKALDGKPLACVAENFWSIVDDDNSLIHYFWEGEGNFITFVQKDRLVSVCAVNRKTGMCNGRSRAGNMAF